MHSPATVIARGPSRDPFDPTHSTVVPSTIEASDSEVRVTVRGPLESVRTPRNSGLPRVSSVLVLLKVMLNTASCGGVTSHRMKLASIPGTSTVQVKMRVSSGQATVAVGVDVNVAEYRIKNLIIIPRF